MPVHPHNTPCTHLSSFRTLCHLKNVGKIQELRLELNSDKKDRNHTRKKATLKKIVANMTMGNDMSSLYPDVIACMAIPVLEVKKMVYLFLINYAKSKPEMALDAINTFRRVTPCLENKSDSCNILYSNFDVFSNAGCGRS